MQMEAFIDARQIEAVLREMPERIQRDVVNSTASRGAAIVRKHARQNLKSNGSIDSGTLYNSVTKSKVKKVHGVYRIYTTKAAPHAHLVEFGTGPRKLKEPTPFEIAPGQWITLKHTGSAPAKPFLRPALDENQVEILREMKIRAAKRLAEVSQQMAQRYSRLSKTMRRKIAK